MDTYHISVTLTTPDASGDPVCLAGTFNDWKEHQYKMAEIKPGEYFVQLDINDNHLPIEFKFIRSKWANVELDEYGGYTANRIIDDPQEPIQAWVPRWRHEGNICSPDFLPILETFEFQIMPRAKKKRRISVLLPYDYHQSNKRYPVMFLMDGQNLYEEGAPFGSWYIHKKMAVLAEKNAHEVILICIDHATVKRIEEYIVPINVNDKGKGNDFLKSVVNNLIPHIHANYRTYTDSSNIGIGGSSLGGLISLMAGIYYPQVFGKLMLLSPSLWKIVNLIYDRLIYLPLISHGQYLYLYGGNKEASNMIGFLRDFHKQLMLIDPSNDKVHLAISEDGEHAERYWGKEFPFALKYLFY